MDKTICFIMTLQVLIGVRSCHYCFIKKVAVKTSFSYLTKQL